MLMLCGVTVTVKDEHHRRDTCPVVVSNYISPVDRLVFSLIQPNIMVSRFNLWFFWYFVSGKMYNSCDLKEIGQNFDLHFGLKGQS